MSDADDIDDLVETLADLPARFATPTSQGQLAIYQTADDGDGYPPPSDATVYYGQLVRPSFPKQIGQQDVSTASTNGDGYIFNLGNGYIPEDTLVVCRKVGNYLFAQFNGPNVYFSSDGESVAAQLGLDDKASDVTFNELFDQTPNPPLFAIGSDDDAWIVADDLTGEDE